MSFVVVDDDDDVLLLSLSLSLNVFYVSSVHLNSLNSGSHILPTEPSPQSLPKIITIS